MARKPQPLRIIPLGGLDGIGKNMTALECGNDIVLVDAGRVTVAAAGGAT